MKKVIILLILLLVTSVSGCQKKYSHHPTAIGPGVEMNGSLELKEDENSNACKIFDWMTSLEAQKLLSEAGYVPVVDVGQ